MEPTPNVNEIFEALKPFLRGNRKDQIGLCRNVEVYIGCYHYSRQWAHENRDTVGGKAMEKLIVASNGLNKAATIIPKCGLRRMEMLYELYARIPVDQNPNPFGLELPWEWMERDLEGVERLARFCEEISTKNIPRTAPESDADTVLLARVGRRAIELRVLNRPGRKRDSLFYKISREVLMLAGFPLQYLDKKVKDAVELI
jgi:hypothetical protein